MRVGVAAAMACSVAHRRAVAVSMVPGVGRQMWRNVVRREIGQR